MTQIFNRTLQNKLNELKEVMRTALMESGCTQEALADEAMTTQPTIQRWFSYDISHFPPLYILALLPASMVIPICNYFLFRFGKRVLDKPKNLMTDGRMEDNILNIDVIIADIISLRDKNPEKAVRACDRLITEVYTLQKEAQQIVDRRKNG